jgi:hypothetical protein
MPRRISQALTGNAVRMSPSVQPAPQWLTPTGDGRPARLGGRLLAVVLGQPAPGLRSAETVVAPQSQWAGVQRGHRPDDLHDCHVLAIAPSEGVVADDARAQEPNRQRHPGEDDEPDGRHQIVTSPSVAVESSGGSITGGNSTRATDGAWPPEPHQLIDHVDGLASRNERAPSRSVRLVVVRREAWSADVVVLTDRGGVLHG